MPQSLRTSNVHQMDAPTHPSQGYTQSKPQESECRLIQRYGKRVWTGFSLPKMLHSG